VKILAKLNKDLSKYPLPRTMSEFIYDSLKEAIIMNELKANQRINEKEIAERFHVSRTPVREAVLRLAAEGFVKIDSYRRAIVKEISFEELGEILQVLGALDRLAVGQAIDRITPKEVMKLEGITEKMEKVCALKSVEKFIELNASFHDELWKSVPNKFLLEILNFVRDKKERYSYARLFAYKKPGFLEKSMKHHRALMRAIKARDKERLQMLIVEHRNILLEKSTAVEKKELKEYLMTNGLEQKD
jgi:DNA-binding GntR family transcriptional regulator